MERILESAGNAGGKEQMGLMASPKKVEEITDFSVLQSIATSCHAEASPAAVKECAETLSSRQLIPRGIWHSHGHMNVFHSVTDHETMARLLPAMAPWNFIRPHPHILSPSITGTDSAVLPLLDGTTMKFHLRGAAFPDSEATEMIEWAKITHTFDRKYADPHAVIGPNRLNLSGGGVAISLEFQEGAGLFCKTEDTSPLRSATTYSLVVNERGSSCAECVIIHDIDGFSFTDRKPCAIRVIGKSHGSI